MQSRINPSVISMMRWDTISFQATEQNKDRKCLEISLWTLLLVAKRDYFNYATIIKNYQNSISVIFRSQPNGYNHESRSDDFSHFFEILFGFILYRQIYLTLKEARFTHIRPCDRHSFWTNGTWKIILV